MSTSQETQSGNGLQQDRGDSGRCLCSAVTFNVTGPPIYNVICHCVNCKGMWFRVNRRLTLISNYGRRQGGSMFHTASIFLKSQYTLHTGSESITIYDDHETQSGVSLRRGFCKVCGSKISALTPLNENIISVPAGILERAGLDWSPQKEQFCSFKARWIPEFGKDLVAQRFVKGPFGEEVIEGEGELK
ncbi:uncharacterized protein A1O9_10137 [Exophiala aquamarina CBS 119918]|uniref:CENP-V/GFA domain-containing protein n=1 Tax=Exophiala aquamarina CBS 119918 TaxID=1182545 RepID=A0A072P1N4_9EURO|nr:uncharacterized protein A1O9_10137 [Exophiala aquamarina CBS 119918]KEF53736.1 hypothetical protein A1O9_10137 [Exophiala aquamarina CBS 119918]